MKIQDRAMLLRLSIKVWSGRKHDEQVDAVVDSHYGGRNIGRFSKMLVDTDVLKYVQAAATAARSWHYEQTLPWYDAGDRILPAANFDAYAADARKLRAEFESQARRVSTMYDQLVRDAQQRLGSAFSWSDYPAEIGSRYSWEIKVSPIPVGADFRVSLQNADVDAIRADIDARTEAAVRAGQADLYRRLAEAVGRMAERLSDKDAKFQESLVGNLVELVDLVPRLDVMDDPTLAEIIERVRTKLTHYTATQLREYPVVRERTAADAAAILEAMRGMYA